MSRKAKAKIEEIRRYISTLNTKNVKKLRTPKIFKLDPVFHGRDSLWRSLLTPDRVLNRIDTLQISDEHYVTIAAKGYPGVLVHNWLSQIVDDIGEANLNFSQFITPLDRGKAQTDLQHHINDLEVEIALNLKQESITPQTTYDKLQSARDRMKTLADGTESAFDIANYFSVHDSDLPKLNRSIASLKSIIRGLQIAPSRLYLQNWDGYKCCMPVGIDSIGMTRHMDTTAAALSIALPGRARIKSGSGGSIIGVEYDTGIPIIFDRFDRSMMNSNVLMLAGSGAGKTFWMSLDIMHQLEMGHDVVIFDTKPDYIKLVEELGGTNVTIKAGSDICINPFVLGTGPNDTLTSHKQELPSFINLLVGVSSAAESVLATCITYMYTSKGIVDNDPDTWKIDPPIMEDLYAALVAYIRGEIPMDIEPDHSTITAAKTLAKDLHPYADKEGLFESFFNGKTTIDLNARLINYDISGVPESVRDAIMYLLLSNTYDYMQQRDRGYRSVYLEEAWSMLAANSEHVKKIVKTCRGFNMSLVIITQDLSDVVGSDAGNAILGNTATKIILGMDVAFAAQVGAMVGLTPAESATLISKDKGVGFLISGGIATRFRTPSAPLEIKLIESQTKTTSNSERFDTTGDFYPCKNLTTQQISILTNLKFDRTRENRLGRGTADYMLRNKAKNQSDGHFIMTHLIRNTARDLGMHSEINDYGKGFDVVVRNGDGSIIGFEIETGKNKWADVIAKADRLNKPSQRLKAKEWFFVVPSGMVEKYAEVHEHTLTGGKIEPLLLKFSKMELDVSI